MNESLEPTVETVRCARFTAGLQILFLGPLAALCTLICFILMFPVVLVARKIFSQGHYPTAVILLSRLMTCWGIFWMVVLVVFPVLWVVAGGVVSVFLLGVILAGPCVAISRYAAATYNCTAGVYAYSNDSPRCNDSPVVSKALFLHS